MTKRLPAAERRDGDDARYLHRPGVPTRPGLDQVTDGDPVNLSAALPREADAVEAWMQRLLPEYGKRLEQLDQLVGALAA